MAVRSVRKSANACSWVRRPAEYFAGLTACRRWEDHDVSIRLDAECVYADLVARITDWAG